jgi:hypothetical protein
MERPAPGLVELMVHVQNYHARLRLVDNVRAMLVTRRRTAASSLSNGPPRRTQSAADGGPGAAYCIASLKRRRMRALSCSI